MAAADDVRDRFEIARLGYAEVLDATKHQDDKIGRFLTSIAFLTTGAIAFSFGVSEEIFQVRFQIGNSAIALPAWAFVVFLISVMLGVVLLIIGLGPNLGLPGERDATVERHDSNLYFLAIRERTTRAWLDSWGASTDISELRTRTTENVLRETYNIATKVAFKYERTNEARAIFSFALLFLALMFALVGYVPISGQKGVTLVDWSIGPRMLTAFVIACFAFLLAYDLMRLAQDANAIVCENRWTRVRRVRLVTIAAPSLVFLALSSDPHSSRWSVFILASIESLLALVIIWAPLSSLRPLWRRSVLVFGGAWATALVGSTIATSRIPQKDYPSQIVILCLLLMLILGLQAPRLLRATSSLRAMSDREPNSQLWKLGKNRPSLAEVADQGDV